MTSQSDAARTAATLRDARAQVEASTRPESSPTPRAALLADYDEQIAHYEAPARGEHSALPATPPPCSRCGQPARVTVAGSAHVCPDCADYAPGVPGPTPASSA